MLLKISQRRKRRCAMPCCVRRRRFALLMSRRDGQRQQHFILNQRQYRQRLFGCYGIRTVIDQIVVRPILPRRHQLQPAADSQRELHAAQTSLATQHRLACDIHLQPRLTCVVPPSFEANRQKTFACDQNVCQPRQFSQTHAAFQHTAAAREFKAIENCSGNRIRHSQALARHKQ